MSSQTNTDNEQSFTRRMVALIDDHRDQVSDEFLRLAMKACKQEFDKNNESDSDSDSDSDVPDLVDMRVEQAEVIVLRGEVSALRYLLESELEKNQTLKKDNDYYTKKIVSLVREIDELKSVQHTHTHSQAQVVPKRTPNAYVLFSKDYREKVREGLPAGQHLSHALGQQWRELVQSTLVQDQAIVAKYHRLATELKRGTTSISQDY